jgi:hypothetical protein
MTDTSLTSCFDAFSLREPGSTSLENALTIARDIAAPAAVRGGHEGQLKLAARPMSGSGRDLARVGAT